MSYEEIYQFLSTNGDGTGVVSAVGDYSESGDGETILYIQPPSDEVYKITRILIYVEDAGSFDSGSYGNGITLTNGIVMRKMSGVETVETLYTPVAITKNPQWQRYCYDAAVSNYGAGNEALAARWTFSKSGTAARLNGVNDERLEIVLSDDFTDLVDQTFFIEGIVVVDTEE